MSEINKVGYDKLRDFVKNSWKYIELQDKAGNPVIRKEATLISHTDGENIIKFQVVVKGSDVKATETNPVTIAKSAIFDVATGGKAIADKDFDTSDVTTLTKDVDQITVVHQINVPEVIA